MPRKVHYPNFWKDKRDVVHWVNLGHAQDWGLQFWQTKVQRSCGRGKGTTTLHIQSHFSKKETIFCLRELQLYGEQSLSKTAREWSRRRGTTLTKLLLLRGRIGKAPSHWNRKRVRKPKQRTSSEMRATGNSTPTLTTPSLRLMFEFQEFQTTLLGRMRTI